MESRSEKKDREKRPDVMVILRSKMTDNVGKKREKRETKKSSNGKRKSEKSKKKNEEDAMKQRDNRNSDR